MTINEIQDEIIEEFESFDDWTDRYALLIDYGNHLEPFPQEKKTDENLIPGCQSKLWFFIEMQNGRIIYHGESDAILVKGLVALLIKVLSNHTAQEIVDADIYFLDAIDLKNHLSPSRSNGLLSMLKQMKRFATEQYEKEKG